VVWFLSLVVLIVLAAIVIAVLNRFYVKSTRDTALIRTGAGGRRVIIDGGAIAWPFLHKIDRMNMRAMRMVMERAGANALITSDRLRIDMALEFHVRVEPSEDGIARAAQALGSSAFREDEMQALLGPNLVDAVQAEVAVRTMDGLHEDRSGFVDAVAARLSAKLERSGLIVDSVSLVRLDQTPFSALDDSNAFNAVGMRRLAEVVSENRKARIDIETATDIAIRKRQLEQTRERLTIERQQEESEIAKRLDIEQRRLQADAEIETARAGSNRITASSANAR
jgi:uncharacterized membrane protein YqiK